MAHDAHTGVTAVAGLAELLTDYCRSEWQLPSVVIANVTPIPEGHSGFTYFVDLVDGPYERMVLRLPPPGAQVKGPADVVRQGRIMRAVRAAGVPAPRVPIICGDPDRLDGRPFIMMEAVTGVRADVAARNAREPDLAAAAVAVMKQVHDVAVHRTGIGDEAAMPLEGELARWTKLISRAPDELVVDGAELARRLEATMPQERPPALVHGDFTYGNLLFQDGAVSAVLDWEISQIGEPLMDLGSLCVIAERHNFPKDPNPSGAIHASVPWLIEQYGATDAPVEWFVALSYYKYAAIVGYNTMLHRRGKRPDPIYDLMPETVTGLIQAGLELIP